ncbi:hypothetical protein IEO21_10749 [Rhodonia placenta]|uniref:Uncharacterized protein n=1 Tax=Rhodonia placenta TaxID=104341 RepID=A0A8H7TW12_9APHY|nr:hypothetical protein IEO21_10749 [Postia placenta]
MTGNSDAAYSAAIEKIDSVERAIELLESKELIPGRQPMSLLIIQDGLLHLARAAAPAATTVECLVAFSRIADAVDMELITSEVANQVCHKTMVAYNILDDGVDKLEQTRIELEGFATRAKEQVRDLEQYRKNIRGEIEKGVEALAEASRQAQKEIQLSAQPRAGNYSPMLQQPGAMFQPHTHVLPEKGAKLSVNVN